MYSVPSIEDWNANVTITQDGVTLTPTTISEQGGSWRVTCDFQYDSATGGVPYPVVTYDSASNFLLWGDDGSNVPSFNTNIELQFISPM
jgi:hypothetical protein